MLGKLYSNIESLTCYIKAFSNWEEVILFRLGYTNNIILKFRNGFELKLGSNQKGVLQCILHLVSDHGINFTDQKSSKLTDWIIDKHNNIVIVPQGIKFILDSFTDATIFSETFLYDIHFVDFDLTGKTIIEAGAFVGDTALYYASKGAKVYSFEPDVNTYNLAKKNIRLNKNLAKNITITNAAIGKDRIINFPLNLGGVASQYVENAKKYIKIESLSIKSIVNKFNIKNPYLLHLDIKGNEFLVIDDVYIKDFDRVRIEYSTKINGKKLGDLNYILLKLRGYGFNNIRVFKHNYGPYSLNEHGTIEARK
ncbi:MAG: FkbM family methyltransferase [Nitrososphaeria archaeon]